MVVFGITMMAIWTIALIFSLIINDEKAFKTEFIIAYIVLMAQFADNYLVN